MRISENAMRIKALVLLSAVTALLLSGCAGSRGGSIPYNSASFGAADASSLIGASREYHLGPGDVLTIKVFGVDSLSGDQQIDSAGRINMSLIGNVPASGMTTDALALVLQQQLGARYLASPQVNVTLKAPAQKTVTVDGSVNQPGIYPVLPRTTLIQAIAMARGTADGANPKRVVVFRRINGERQAAAFDLTTVRKGADPDPEIYPEDVIVVDGSSVSKGFRTVLQTIPLIALFRPF